MPDVLLVEDDRASREALERWLAARDIRVHSAPDLASARATLAQGTPDLALVDLELPDGSGMELLEELGALVETEVVVITGHATVDKAVGALRRGVQDFLTKPLDLQRLATILQELTQTLQLRRRVDHLRSEARTSNSFGLLLGGCPAMQKVYDRISRVAPSEAAVLVTGETGSGKELVAHTIHQLSRREGQPIVAVNCGALSPTLVESELFGHERGSFTGAMRTHRGIFEQAHGGTLFLDEITEMPIELQVRLLRVLETGTVTRVGGQRSVDVDVRIVSASNRDPKQAVAQGKLREDLLYRLLVFPIELPPLRDRGEDIVLLAQAFLRHLNDQAGSRKSFREDALELLSGHPWPGNVRELRNVVEQAFLVARGDIDAASLPFGPAEVRSQGDHGDDRLRLNVGMSIADAERNLILATLDAYKGNKRKAAEVLGISLKTLYARLSVYRAAEEANTARTANA